LSIRNFTLLGYKVTPPSSNFKDEVTANRLQFKIEKCMEVPTQKVDLSNVLCSGQRQAELGDLFKLNLQICSSYCDRKKFISLSSVILFFLSILHENREGSFK
jgi:hypothetical protein